MPLLFSRYEKNYVLGVWQITENQDFFYSALTWHPKELEELYKLKGRRQVEWLACRFLAHQLLTQGLPLPRVPILKDAYGKPHFDILPSDTSSPPKWPTDWLLSGPAPEISFSHSHGLAAVLIAHVPAGIDIQRFTVKILSIATRFLSEEELAGIPAEHFMDCIHCYWCIKEALYKAHGCGGLDFRRHMRVEPFPWQPSTKTRARIMKDGLVKYFEIHFEQMDDFFMAISILDQVFMDNLSFDL